MKKQMNTNDDELIFGLRNLATFLQISVPTACRLARERKFPSYMAGKRKLFFRKSEVFVGIQK